MASYKTLFRLVNGLNKAEKRQFAKWAEASAANGMYTWMYHHLQKHPSNFSVFKNDFKKKYPRGSLTTSMNHLYENIMSMLIRQQHYQDIENRVIMLLQQIKVLYARGFYEECAQLSDKAIAICRKYEMNTWLLILVRLKLMLKTSTRFFRLQESELLALHNSIRQALNYLQTQSQHQLQYDLLHLRRPAVKQATEVMSGTELDDLAMHEQQIFSNARYTSIEADKLHMMFQAEYFLARGNTETSLRVGKSLHEHFLANSQLMQSPLHYVTHLAGLLQNFYQRGDFDLMIEYETKLAVLTTSPHGVEDLANYVLIHYQLQRNIAQHAFDQLPNLLVQADVLIQKSEPPYAWEYAQLLRLSMTIAYFLLQEYHRALQMLATLRANDVGVTLNPIQYTARIVQILIFFKQAEYTVMEAEIRSFYRSLRKQVQQLDKERLLFKLFLDYPLKHIENKEKLTAMIIEKPTDDQGGRAGLMQQSLVIFNWIEILF